MRVLNLYAGIGGNRAEWQAQDVTAVEIDSKIANAYQQRFPNDTVIVADAHEYLEANYSQFDFIWSSPPCPTHGQYRYNVGFRAKGYRAVFPDMKLYEEVLFLQYYFKGLWCVENTKPYYTPLVEPTVSLQRHLLWSNFDIPERKFSAKNIRSKNKISDYSVGFDITKTDISNKRQVLRNCVDSELAKYVWECMVGQKNKKECDLQTTHNSANLPLFQQQV